MKLQGAETEFSFHEARTPGFEFRSDDLMLSRTWRSWEETKENREKTRKAKNPKFLDMLVSFGRRKNNWKRTELDGEEEEKQSKERRSFFVFRE